MLGCGEWMSLLTFDSRFVDTFQGIFEMYKEMGPGGLGMVSQMTVKETGPMI